MRALLLVSLILGMTLLSACASTWSGSADVCPDPTMNYTPAFAYKCYHS